VKPEAPLDDVSFLRELPVWSLCVKELSLLAREWRYSPATGSTGFGSKNFGHVASLSRQPFRSDAVEGTHFTVIAALGWIKWPDLGSVRLTGPTSGTLTGGTAGPGTLTGAAGGSRAAAGGVPSFPAPP
jgi:hypothetical protein